MDEIRVQGRGLPSLDAVVSDRRSAVLAAALVALLAVGGSFVALRASPARIAPPSTYEAWTPNGSPSAAALGDVVMVHVAGAVKHPGLYPLAAGARFADAVAAAGGPTAQADLHSLNLAQLALDGTKVEVPMRGKHGAPGMAVDPAPTTAASPAVLSLNSADQAGLETIPGIGPVTAAAILQHRDEIGGFTSLEQLLDVSGIGPATYESMRDFVSL